MAGFREFLTGEVLTAANVNSFLMKQSVMVFADAAARTAALGAEVAEGMLTYNEDTAQLEVFDGAAFVLAAPAPPAGIGPNVVQTVKTDVFSTSSATFVDITGLTATITPSSATAKILLIATVNLGVADNNEVALRFAGGNAGTFIGDTAGTRTRAANFLRTGSTSAMAPNNFLYGGTFLDAPATASAVTYSVTLAMPGGGTIQVNRGSADTNDPSLGRTASSLVVIEVAA